MPLRKATADGDPQLEEWEGVHEDPAVAHLTRERNHLLSDENKIAWAKQYSPPCHFKKIANAFKSEAVTKGQWNIIMGNIA